MLKFSERILRFYGEFGILRWSSSTLTRSGFMQLDLCKNKIFSIWSCSQDSWNFTLETLEICFDEHPLKVLCICPNSLTTYFKGTVFF